MMLASTGMGRGVPELVDGGVDDVSLVEGAAVGSLLVAVPFVEGLVTGGAVAAESGVTSDGVIGA